MSLIIHLSRKMEASLASQARAAHITTERYAARIIECALISQHRQAVEKLERCLDDMAFKILPETTPGEMEAALEEASAAARPLRSWCS